MDVDVLNSMFKTNLETVKSFVELLFNKQRDEISELKTELSEVRRSLEFSQAELAETRELVETLTDAKASSGNLDHRMRTLEDLSKAKNLRISGLDERSNENPEQTLVTVQNFIRDRLQEPNVRVKDAFRVNVATDNTVRREIIARLGSVNEKSACLRSRTKLKGSDIYVNEDVSYATQQIRKSLLPELKRKREEGYIAYFSGIRIKTRLRQTGNRNQGVGDNGTEQGADGTTSGAAAGEGRGDDGGDADHGGGDTRTGQGAGGNMSGAAAEEARDDDGGDADHEGGDARTGQGAGGNSDGAGTGRGRGGARRLTSGGTRGNRGGRRAQRQL